MSKTTNKIALSFDIEDWFTVRNMRESIDESTWDQQELRVQIGTQFVLDALREKNIKATFFVLGWIAERAPEMVKQIVSEGHELATHGYAHTPIDLLTPETFREDLKKSIHILESIAGVKIKGFRAPSFSITEETSWAIPILKECGIEYDSSIFVIRHPDYGVSKFPKKMTNLDGIIEVPMQKGKLFGLDVPVCGGGYFRMLPYKLIESSLKETLKQDNVVMYFHPWEFDVDQPRVHLPAIKKFRHYVGLSKNGKKFKQLLEKFEFVTMRELIEIEKQKGILESFTFTDSMLLQ